MGGDPANGVDPSGGMVFPNFNWVSDLFGTLAPVTVIGKLQSPASKMAQSFAKATEQFFTRLAFTAAGFTSAISDNAFGTNFLVNNAPSPTASPQNIEDWNTGVSSGHGASLGISLSEGYLGDGMMGAGSAALLGAPATGPAAPVAASSGALSFGFGAALSLHGAYSFGNTVTNIAKGQGIVKYEQTIPDAPGSGSSTSGTSAGQMQKKVERNQAPNSVKRVDKGRAHKEQDNIHFKDGTALNRDGTWKHGSRKLTNAEINFLEENGWGVPKN